MPRTPAQTLVIAFIAAACLGATAYMVVDILMHPRSAHPAGLSIGEPPPVLWSAPSFAMIDQDGKPVTDEQLRGKAWIAGFFFTSCPMICPQMTMKMKAFQDRLAQYDQLTGKFEIVFFSIDPKTDQPARLKQHAEAFQADETSWRFVTHPQGDRDAVWQMVGVDGFKMTLADAPDDPQGNIIEHSPRFMLIDAQGQVRDTYDSRDAPAMDRLLHDIFAVIAENDKGASR